MTAVLPYRNNPDQNKKQKKQNEIEKHIDSLAEPNVKFSEVFTSCLCVSEPQLIHLQEPLIRWLVLIFIQHKSSNLEYLHCVLTYKGRAVMHCENIILIDVERTGAKALAIFKVWLFSWKN